jgi:hypothetical protein
MSSVLTFPLPTTCPQPYHKLPFSAFAKALYLGFRGKWLDLTYGNSGVLALGPKFPFHVSCHFFVYTANKFCSLTYWYTEVSYINFASQPNLINILIFLLLM